MIAGLILVGILGTIVAFVVWQIYFREDHANLNDLRAIRKDKNAWIIQHRQATGPFGAIHRWITTDEYSRPDTWSDDRMASFVTEVMEETGVKIKRELEVAKRKEKYPVNSIISYWRAK